MLNGKKILEEIIVTPLEGTDLIIQEFRNISALLELTEGILPICSHCKNIRDKNGTWHVIEEYFHNHSGADFSHGLCPKCLEEYYPELHEYLEKNEQTNC